MKTKRLVLRTDWVESRSLWAWWYKNDQMGCYEERKEGKTHGDYKRWSIDGLLRWHYIYENGEWMKL